MLRQNESTRWRSTCVKLVLPHTSAVYFEGCVDMAVREMEQKAEKEVYTQASDTIDFDSAHC